MAGLIMITERKQVRNKGNYLAAEVTYIKDRTLHQLGLIPLLHIQTEALRPKQAIQQ